jgi:hypothetical protein
LETLTTPAQFRLVIVTPVYEDAAAGSRLLEELGNYFVDPRTELRVLLVDDGSRVPVAQELSLPKSLRDARVEVLRLRRNVGHQRAIALGTAYVHDQVPCDAMLVMDADGEDRPEDAVRLVQRCRESGLQRIIFAERTRRSESRLFLLLYRFYQALHWILTGIRVRVGNFSVVPARSLPTLVTLPEMWNHYAAAIFHSNLAFESLPTRRGSRYSGRSKMNYLSLVMHGLHAISVFTDLIAVRLLIVVFGMSCLCTLGLLTGLALHFSANPVLPGWAAYVAGALLILLLLTMGSFSLVLHVLSQRNSLDFIPIRDFKYFVDSVSRLAPSNE